MAVEYVIRATRPSLNDKFYIEQHTIEPSENYAEFGPLSSSKYKNPVLVQDGISSTYDELIPWSEVITRKNELRSDILLWLNQQDTNQFNNSEIWGDGPAWNPFELTFTTRATFNSIEEFNHYYELSTNQYMIGVLAECVDYCDNTLVEELYVDGVLTDFTKKIQPLITA